jgi:hypothetical protein
MWARVVSSLLICAGCLGPPTAPEQEPPAAVVAVSVHDAAGGAWPAAAVPRWPVLALTFDRAPRNLEARLWLVAGHPHPDLLDDLADPPLRASTLAAVVPLTVTGQGLTARAEPARALEPGAPYALVWTGGELPAWFALRVSASPAAGARLAESWPGDRDMRVPPNLSRLLLRFDGYVVGLPAELSLRDAAGGLHALRSDLLACEELGLPAGDCAWLTPAAPLAAMRSYELALEGLRDATGAALPVQAISFATRVQPDTLPPGLESVACALDELSLDAGCLLASDRGVVLRGSADEPVLVTLHAGGVRSARLAFGGMFELPLTGLAEGVTLEAELRLDDLAGHATARRLSLQTAYALPRLAIDELRADPLGPEPAQEYVELLNFGIEPVHIIGFSLTDDAFDPGRRVVSALAVEPGERVLVVGPEFDAREPSDGLLPAGVRLARLDGALSLRNDGELLILRDEQGRRIAESPRLAAPVAGQCIGRLVHDEGSEFIVDPGGSCTPGTPTLASGPSSTAAAEPGR